MLETDILTALFALGAALAWGSGDFSGGLASRRHNVYSVLLAAQLVSIAPLLVLALVFEQALPRASDLLAGAVGGVFGVVGLVSLYTGLARGRMGIVAPLAAIIASIIPVCIGMITEGAPTLWQTVGFAIALIAIWLLSSDGGRKLEATPVELRFALLAGVGFAAFYLALDSFSGETALWPVFAARLASMSLLALYVSKRRQWSMPPRPLLPLVALTGLLDTAGNFFFVLAAQAGRLDVATVVSSLYPAITVLFAWLILKEHLKFKQRIGVLTAFAAITLIAL
ncbi:DMT family transporter [Candidatus Thiothrix sp. Deng01]|uniref:DMT family transporter n=1 Tax=Candidatus Thiothrix phosphatis TaxID=3112415 RepID=A0ABU6CTJ3_9GAMM|nr:DMT family transporter [Candidatus Thiothrix sp. Deng01]MEB4589718.1 DMT family transporter [Candidatus Thiothrix sp. Deng01]